MFSLQTLSFKDFSQHLMQGIESYFLFNFLYFGLSVLIFAGMNRKWESVHPMTAILAVCFGFIFIMSIYLYMQAMSLGPVSISSLIYSMAMFIPILCGALFWDEPISLTQLIGLAFLLMTFMLTSQASGTDKEPTARWLMYCLAACLFNGLLMTLSKLHQKLFTGMEVEEFLMIAFGAAALISLFIFAAKRIRHKGDLSRLRQKRFVLLVVAAGLTTGIGNLAALELAGRIPAVIQFPCTNGGYVILSSILSSVIYKERISRKRAAGLAVGLVGLILLSSG